MKIWLLKKPQLVFCWTSWKACNCLKSTEYPNLSPLNIFFLLYLSIVFPSSKRNSITKENWSCFQLEFSPSMPVMDGFERPEIFLLVTTWGGTNVQKVPLEKVMAYLIKVPYIVHILHFNNFLCFCFILFCESNFWTSQPPPFQLL